MLNGFSEKDQQRQLKRLHSRQQAAFLGTLGESPPPEPDGGDCSLEKRRGQR